MAVLSQVAATAVQTALATSVGPALEVINALNKVATPTQAELAAVANMPASATLTPAAGTSNVSLVSIQLKDAAGAALGRTSALDIWLSDAATGIGLTAQTASGAVTAGASGTDFGNTTSKKALQGITDATGLFILSITDTGKNLFYVCASLPNGKVFVSAQLTSGSYG